MSFEPLNASREVSRRDGDVRIFRSGNAVTIRLAIGDLAKIKINGGDKVDLLIDRSVTPPRVAIVAGSSLTASGFGRQLQITARALAPFVEQGAKWVSAVDFIRVGQHEALCFSLPEKTNFQKLNAASARHIANA